jgi:hypothetical protein
MQSQPDETIILLPFRPRVPKTPDMKIIMDSVMNKSNEGNKRPVPAAEISRVSKRPKPEDLPEYDLLPHLVNRMLFRQVVQHHDLEDDDDFDAALMEEFQDEEQVYRRHLERVSTHQRHFLEATFIKETILMQNIKNHQDRHDPVKMAEAMIFEITPEVNFLLKQKKTLEAKQKILDMTIKGLEKYEDVMRLQVNKKEEQERHHLYREHQFHLNQTGWPSQEKDLHPDTHKITQMQSLTKNNLAKILLEGNF